MGKHFGQLTAERSFPSMALTTSMPRGRKSTYSNTLIVTFKRVTSDYYVVSGARGGSIFYERCNFPNDSVLNCIYISYPAREKAGWVATVTRISHSLRSAPADR